MLPMCSSAVLLPSNQVELLVRGRLQREPNCCSHCCNSYAPLVHTPILFPYLSLSHTHTHTLQCIQSDCVDKTEERAEENAAGFVRTLQGNSQVSQHIYDTPLLEKKLVHSHIYKKHLHQNAPPPPRTHTRVDELHWTCIKYVNRFDYESCRDDEKRPFLFISKAARKLS